MGKASEIKIPLKSEYAEFNIVRDGKTFMLAPDELEIAGYAAEYRWLAKELEFRLSDSVWYGLEKQAGLIRGGLMDPGVLLESCWCVFWDECRSASADACIAKGAENATIEAAGILWMEFGDVPMDGETECIETSWRGFPAGTHREEIWHWFEERFDLSVARDLMRMF